MIRFVAMEPWHVPQIALRAGQHGTLGLIQPELTEKYGYDLIDAGPCWVGIDSATGMVIGAAGFTLPWAGQASAWALFSDCLDAHARPVIRFVRQCIAQGGWARVEAMTRWDRPEQGRFAQACGFRRVTVLRRWGPASIDMVLHEVVDGKMGEKRHASTGR